MSTKIIIGIVGMFVLGVGSLYLIKQVDFGATSLTNIEDVTELDMHQTIADEETSGSGTLMALMGRKASMQCTFSSQEGEILSEGTFYFDHANERFRVDTQSVVDGELSVLHVINDGENMYTWGTGMEMGIIMDAQMIDISEESFGQYDGEHVDETSMDLDGDVEYDCNGWKVEESIFTPDTSIEFLDTESMMKDMMDGLPEGFNIDAYSDLQVN